jgi:integrase
MLRFILLTATRRNEALYARRSEIVGTEWTIPAARYKTKIDHLVPLSQAALAQLPNEEGHGDWVLTANGKQAIGGRSRHKAAIDEASGASGWAVQDLRRTIPHEPCWRPHRPRRTLPGPCHRRGSRRTEISLRAPRQSCRSFKRPLKRDRRFSALRPKNRFSKKSLP